MSFGFQFDGSEMDEEYLSISEPQEQSTFASTSAYTTSTEQAPFHSHNMQEMLQNLPSRMSYSSINVNLPNGTQRLVRRDLFDARFQMLLDEDEEDETEQGEDASGSAGAGAKGNVDADSDLIPGVYEGGLKTWECALDLVETLEALHTTSGGSTADGSWSSRLRGKNALELGCGTALPSLFILSQVLKDPLPSASKKVGLTLHLADYNAQVLQLVTLPNLILTWYSSPAASSFRSGTEAEHLQERQELARRGQDHFDTSLQADLGEEGELSITDELLSAFTSSLAERGIQLQFYSGAWSNFPPSLTGIGMKTDMILTSETIYSLESLPALVELLSKYSKVEGEEEAGLVLVAAKVIYFGVGGGVESFKQTLSQLTPSAKVEPLHSVTKGVGRTVLSVTF